MKRKKVQELIEQALAGREPGTAVPQVVTPEQLAELGRARKTDEEMVGRHAA
jgi:hypothetical protein